MTKPKKKEGFLETIKTIIFALILAGIFRTLFFQPFWIPSGSMKDTLLIGDFLFVNKMSYGYSYASCPTVRIAAIGLNIDAEDICGFLRGDNKRIIGAEPTRGDVVVFRHPTNGQDYIKRLIALPGEKVQIKNGLVFINDTPVKVIPNGTFNEIKAPQGPFRNMPRCANEVVEQNGICEKEKFIEILPNGVSHSILNFMRQTVDDTPVYHVPEGHYFFLGDNRDNSSDSRISQSRGGVGFVPYENLVGRADRVLLSSAGKSMFAFWTWRRDRFFEGIE